MDAQNRSNPVSRTAPYSSAAILVVPMTAICLAAMLATSVSLQEPRQQEVTFQGIRVTQPDGSKVEGRIWFSEDEELLVLHVQHDVKVETSDLNMPIAEGDLVQGVSAPVIGLNLDSSIFTLSSEPGNSVFQVRTIGTQYLLEVVPGTFQVLPGSMDDNQY